MVGGMVAETWSKILPNNIWTKSCAHVEMSVEGRRTEGEDGRMVEPWRNNGPATVERNLSTHDNNTPHH